MSCWVATILMLFSVGLIAGSIIDRHLGHSEEENQNDLMGGDHVYVFGGDIAQVTKLGETWAVLMPCSQEQEEPSDIRFLRKAKNLEHVPVSIVRALGIRNCPGRVYRLGTYEGQVFRE